MRKKINSDSEDELLYTHSKLTQVANVSIQNLLPEKSQNRYAGVYKNVQGRLQKMYFLHILVNLALNIKHRLYGISTLC